MIDISKTRTETNTEKIFNTDTTVYTYRNDRKKTNWNCNRNDFKNWYWNYLFAFAWNFNCPLLIVPIMAVSHSPYGFYGQVTVKTVGWPGAWPCWPYWPYRIFALEQKFCTVRLTVGTVATDRRDRTSWPYLAARMVSTISCYGPHGQPYGLYGQLLRLIKSGLDRGGFISTSAFKGST